MREGWVETTLGEVTAVNPGRLKRVAPDDVIRYVDISSVSWDSGIDICSVAAMPFGQAPGRARRPINEKDVVVSTVRPRLRAMGQVPPSLAGQVASTGLCVLRAHDSQVILPDYVWQVVRHQPFTDWLVERETGSNYPAVRSSDIEAYPFLLPPVEEQRRIVDLMGHIDAMIHATTLSLDALRASREAALSDLIPLVPESGTPLSSVSTITDCEHKTAPTAKEHESVAGRVIGTPAIRDGRIISAEARPVSAATYSEWTGRRVPHQGDVVLTREAPVGQAALIREEHGPLCLGQRTVLLSPGSSYDSAFLLSLLMSPAYQRWLRGASVSQTVERINVKRLSEMPVPQLPVEAQRAVGAQLEAMLEAEDRGVDEIERLRALRAACLSALVTGSHEIPSAYDEFLSDEGWRDGVR